MPRHPIPVEVRLLAKCVPSAVNSYNGVPCLEWTGSITSKEGYGKIRDEGNRIAPTHRIAYRLWVEEPRPDQDVDHLCENPPCCEPTHLEAVSHAENVRRASKGNAKKTHCPANHPYSAENTRIRLRANGSQSRQCLTCETEQRLIRNPVAYRRGPYKKR